MEYLSPKELSAKFAMPLRTVYHHIANGTEIRSKKKWRTKLVNVADFAKTCNLDVKDLQNVVKSESEKEDKSEIRTLQTSLQNLQRDYNGIKEEKTNLQRFNSNLQEQVGKYAILLSEEKSEKKDILNRYDSLQSKYHIKVEILTKRFYFLLGIAVLLLAIIALQFAPNLQNRL